MDRKPRVPESACFRKVAMASVVANLPVTHLTAMFYLFKSSFRLKQEILPVRTLHLFTCIKSQVLLYLRHTFFLNLRHISFVSGRLPKVDQFMVC